MSEESGTVLERVEREQETYLEELKEYLRIPSISTDPAHSGDVTRCAEFLRGKMEEAGLAAELVSTARNPLVFGEWTGAPGKPTLLFYGHYDVQPPDPLEEWRNPPFEPTVEGDLLVARGATDDKGQSFAHLKAVGAMLAERGELPVNVKFLVEGEEESGGESIDHYVRQDGGQRLACDAVIVSDSSMYAPGQPSLLYGLKGLAYMQIDVRGPSRDLHSGSYGGGVANPANALASILSQLLDQRTGRVSIPGFYDDVVPLADWERQGFAALPHDEAAYCREVGVHETFGEEGYTTLERVWARPTCDVNGIFGGYQGQGAKTVLPARAGAKVSMRLVPEQRPKDIAAKFSEYVHRIAPAGVTVEVSDLHGAEPVLIDVQGPIAEAAKSALEDVWGKRPVLVREGGSIPIVATFAQQLSVPILLMGFGLNDDALHSPNEKFNISHFYSGIGTIVRLLDRVGDIGDSQ
jgi:acetylornithine deacetylase/succinyl-diaminopimelate desuccinylase-like protein